MTCAWSDSTWSESALPMLLQCYARRTHSIRTDVSSGSARGPSYPVLTLSRMKSCTARQGSDPTRTYMDGCEALWKEQTSVRACSAAKPHQSYQTDAKSRAYLQLESRDFVVHPNKNLSHNKFFGMVTIDKLRSIRLITITLFRKRKETITCKLLMSVL